MSLRKGLVLSAAVLSLVFLFSCGSSPNPATPPPSGGFSASNLNGTYVFSTSGTDVNGAPIMMVGAFTACGCSGGTISGGAFSFDDGSNGNGSNQAITGGIYSVTQDGRGQAHLNNSSGLGNITLDFVLSSSSGGSVAEYDTNGTGSGTLELQSSVAQSDIDAQSYAFSFSGTGIPDANGNFNPFSTAGAFTLDSSGAVSTGVQDVVNLNFSTSVLSAQTALPIATSSTVAVGTGTSPGTAQISPSGGGTYSFDVYAVSKSHLKFIETDGVELTSGDVFTQQPSLPSGTLAFVMGGIDQSGLPLALGGQLPTSNATISGGIEDYNDGGAANTTSSVSGSFSALTGGRSVVTLSGFENGATNAALSTYSFSAYPSTGGLMLLEIDSNGLTAGNALAQTSTTLAASTGYGLDLSATNLSSSTGTSIEEDDIAEFTATSSSFSGLIDINDEGQTSFDQKFSGSYTSQSTGRYSFSSSDFNGMFYTVDGSTVLVLETDSTQIGTGGLLVQTTPGSAHLAYARVHLPALRVAAGARMHRK